MSKYVKLDDAINVVTMLYGPLDSAPVRNLLKELPCVELQTARAIFRHYYECLPPMDFVQKEMAQSLVELAAKSGCIKITAEHDPRTQMKLYLGELEFACPEDKKEEKP